MGWPPVQNVPFGGPSRGRCQGGGGVTGRFRIEVSFNRLHLLLRSKPLEAGNTAGGVGFGWNGFKGGGDGTFQTLKLAPGMAQSDFSFRGMNVDVHLVGWAIKVHHRQRVPSLHQSGLENLAGWPEGKDLLLPDVD